MYVKPIIYETQVFSETGFAGYFGKGNAPSNCLDTRWVSQGKNGKLLLIPMLCNALLGSPQLYLTGALIPVIPVAEGITLHKRISSKGSPIFLSTLVKVPCKVLRLTSSDWIRSKQRACVHAVLLLIKKFREERATHQSNQMVSSNTF